MDRLDRIETRLERIEKLLSLGNFRGPDPTAAPEAAAEFSELLKSLRVDTGVIKVDDKQGCLL